MTSMGASSDAVNGKRPGDEGGTETDVESGAPRQRATKRTPGDTAAAADALPLRSRDRYERLGEHARGGLGTITRARDLELGRSLAIKEMQEPAPGAVDRFVREARITMRLEHPSIVPVHDAGRWDSGEPFYAMKLVAGRTLKEVVQERPTLGERMALLPNLIAVADAIAYAHQQRIVHRDLKASNVLVGAFGETIVIDWGLAKDLSIPDDPAASSASPYRNRTDATEMGTVVGTPSFMPPEQARGEEVDERADVYALGALLYFVLSGRAPHEGTSSAEVLARVKTESPEPISQRVPGVPADLASIVNRAMARDKEARYPSAQQLADDLKRYQAGQAVGAHRYSITELTARWARRHRTTAAATALFLMLSAIGLLAFGVRESRLRHVAEVERNRADQKTLALLEQQGRAELRSGRPFRAAVFLSDALLKNPASVTLRSLLTQAVRPMARMQRELRGHTDNVPYVAYSADGSRIVTASTDKTVRIWSADTGALLHVLQHDDGLDVAEFSPDGKLVVAGCLDGTVRIWDAATGALVRTIQDDGGYRVAFTPDGTRVVVGSQRGQLRVHDAVSGEVVFTAKPHTDRIHQIAFSPDGRTMVLASWDKSVSLWNVADFKLLRTLPDHEKEVSSVAFSHDGARLLTAESDVYIHVRDAATGARLYDIRMPEGARWPTVAFSEDERAVYATAHDGVLRTWSAASGTLLATVDTQAMGKLMHGALRPGGRELVTSGAAGSVAVWTVGGGEDALGYRILEWPSGHDEEAVYPAVYTPDGRRMFASGSSGKIAAWDASSGKLLLSFDAGQDGFSLAPNRDGSRLAVGGTTRGAALWDLSSAPSSLTELRGPTKLVDNLAFNADGTLLATASYDGSVRLYDAQTGEGRGAWPVGGGDRLTAVAFDPKGGELAVTTGLGKLLFVDRGSGKIRRTVQAHKTWIQDVEYSRDGARVLTSGRQDHTAHVWNVETGALELTLAGHVDNIMQGSFSPDGRFIATAALDHVANVWDARTGELLRSIPGGDYSATFSPRGDELLTTGYLGHAVVWDLTLDTRSADELSDFVQHRSPWTLVDGRLELRREAETP
jgi:WD40 repeat protein